MKVLVTGGTGFVGGHLIEQLRRRGDHVRALVRPGSDRGFVESLGADVAIGDLDDPDSLRAACEGCEVVYHAAARVEIVGSEDEFQRTTVGGTTRMVRAANEARVRRFVHISSCGVYHPRLLASAATVNELTETPEPPRWFTYGRAKYRAEKAVRREIAEGRDWVIVRLGYLYGPRNQIMRTYLEPALRKNIMTIVGDGENEMALVDVVDAVRAVARAGVTPDAVGKILIAGPNERVTQQQYFDALARGFGLPPITKTVPYWLAFVAGWFCEYVGSADRRKLVSRATVALTGLPQRLDCSRTQQLLDWQPRVRFADGIRWAIEWYQAEYGVSARHGDSTNPGPGTAAPIKADACAR